MSVAIINSISVISKGTDAEWAAMTVPIINGMLIQVTDLNIIKQGDGVTMYSSLPTLIELGTHKAFNPGYLLLWPEDLAGNIPNGFLLADGAYVSKVTYAALYAVCGDIYGSTSTTFRLPRITAFNDNVIYLIKY